MRLATLFVFTTWASLRAQDVTVLDPIWFRTEPRPDVMPKPTHGLRPDYPDELKKIDVIGYAIVDRFIASSGDNLIFSSFTTHLPFLRAVEAETLSDWKMTVAKREGHPIDGRIWLPVIFNPKSASTRGRDATPRLLAVTPVFLPNPPKAEIGLPPLLTVHFLIDETGAITLAESRQKLTPPNEAALRVSLQGWKFAPARKEGQPIKGEVEMPVICQAPLNAAESAYVPARVIQREPAEYPRNLVGTGFRGNVSVAIEIDTEGKVQEATISSSSGPPFEAPSLAAARHSTFQPATRDGKPVRSKMTMMYSFATEEQRDTFAIKIRGDQSKLPPELRFDTPAKLRSILAPIFPYALRRDHVFGKAVATMLIDPRGHVASVRIREADQPEFGFALAAAIEGFLFDPALKDGKPVAHLLSYEQIFSEDQMPDPESRRLLVLEQKHPELIFGPAGLDTPLKPVSRRAPLYPAGLPGVNSGNALVEFLVDDEGVVRLPRVVSASDALFGYAAVQAVGTWLFEPPKASGKAAVARVRVPFNFQRPPPAAPGAKSPSQS